MTRISTFFIVPKQEWTTIKVPFGSKLVWAEPIAPPGPRPAPATQIKLFCSGSDEPIGTSTCLIRVGSEPTQPSPGSPDPNPKGGYSGISEANAFINNELFLWWKIDLYGNGDYPPNQPNTGFDLP
ncbi:hypothetical protein ACFWF7_16360 [Nocardia sp. NPDC060256]|uniref:hypothetical protein n=1 Tax=unclassified Nocardia TaxID=2637762 RepID=UPI00365C1929